MTGERDRVIDAPDIDAVIFDMDSVVSDTASIHAMAWKHLFDRYLKQRARQNGEPFQPFDADSDYRRYLDGKPRYDGVKSFLESRGISLPYGNPTDAPDRETVCGLGNRKNRYFFDHLRERPPKAFPSSVKFIRDVRARGVRTAVISSSQNCADILEAAGVGDLFDVKVDGVDVGKLGLKGKPDPAILLEAAKRLGVEPSRAMGIEVTLAGVEAGYRGGFGLVVGVDMTGQGERLKERGAHLVVHDLGDLVINRGSHSAETAASAAEDLPSALDRREEIAQLIESSVPVVFLDYDGTLTRIVDKPPQALLPEETRETMVRLMACCPVVIMSGRDLNDVRNMVGIEGLVYAGSHGFDIAGPQGPYPDQGRGQQFLPALDGAETELKRMLEDIPGVWVERKRFAVAVHYRGMEDRYMGELEHRVNKVYEQHPELRRSTGKKIFELRPDVDWDKGKALLWLLETFELHSSPVIPLYIGDDLTDEDAFQAIRDRGIGIVVGQPPHRTAARYMLQDPAEVKAFLDFLAALLERGAQ